MTATLGPIRYAAANAAIRAGLSQLLTPEQWRRLLAASELDEFIDRLGATAYGSVISALGNDRVDLAQLERALAQYLVQASRAPFKFLQGQPRALLEWLWRRFDLDNLKILLRAIATQTPAGQIRSSLLPLADGSDLPWGRLAGARSIPALIEQLDATYAGSFYAQALQPALNRYRREGALFLLEISLDLAYYRQLLELVNQLGGRDRQAAGRFVGTMIDAQNLLWAFRYRDNFGLSPEEILSYTLQRKLKVDSQVVQQVAAGAPLIDLLDRLWPDRLPGLARMRELPAAEALPAAELIFQRYLYRQARHAVRGYAFHLGTILAYERLVESEVQDLITVVEARTAGWRPRQIAPHLIGDRLGQR